MLQLQQVDEPQTWPLAAARIGEARQFGVSGRQEADIARRLTEVDGLAVAVRNRSLLCEQQMHQTSAFMRGNALVFCLSRVASKYSTEGLNEINE